MLQAQAFQEFEVQTTKLEPITFADGIQLLWHAEGFVIVLEEQTMSENKKSRIWIHGDHFAMFAQGFCNDVLVIVLLDGKIELDA